MAKCLQQPAPHTPERVIIESVTPEIDGGRFPAKRVLDESVTVQADIFGDGHDRLSAVLLQRGPGESDWCEIPMIPLANDRWEASFVVTKVGVYI